MKNLVINFYWICSIMNIYICCSCTNSIFGKIFVPEIWAKMFSANQIAEYFNQTYLQHKSVICPDILHVDTNSHKLSLSKHSWVGTIKNGCGQSSYGTLYIVLYILDLAVAERILWNRRCPSFLPVCLSVWMFSWNWIIRFQWILAWCFKPLWSCVWQSWIFWENLFCPKIGERSQN